MTKPLQVYLDDRDLERLEEFARERGWTKSQAIRTAVRALTRRSSSDPVLDLSGDIDALPPDLSREFDFSQPPRPPLVLSTSPTPGPASTP